MPALSEETWIALLWAALALGALFCLLGIWQRRIRQHATAMARAEIQNARERRVDAPMAQHPQIDVLRCIGCGSCIRACPEDEVIGLVSGVAHIVQGSRCVGHGLCADACPVNALTIGLGDLALRPDIPVVTCDLESNVPGVFLAGEVGGLALIRNAVDQGSRVASTIAHRLGLKGRANDSRVADVLVVGAGPAGISAILKCVELGLNYVAIDQEDAGGTILKYPRRKLVMTQPIDIPLYGSLKGREHSKEDLLALWEKIVQDFRLEIRTHVKLLGLSGAEGLFEAMTSAGAIHARHVILALGRRGTPRKLGVPGEELPKVLYQLMDASTYSGQRILVVGGGDSAVEATTALADQPGNEVTLSYRKPSFARLKRRNEERIQSYAKAGRARVIYSSNIVRIRPSSVELAIDGEEVPVVLENDYVLVFAGGDPPFALLREMGIRFSGDKQDSPTTKSRALA